jgi:lauroyl/myristoyl acyltransferase
VFAVRDPGDATLRVIVEPPIPVANVGDADAALQEAAQRFGERMERYVRAHPVQWRDWKNLKLPG